MKKLILILLLFVTASAYAGELVHLTIENRQVVGSDYTFDVYAEPDGTWRVGPCTVIIKYNSLGLDASDYDGNNVGNFDSDLSSGGYSCTQGDYATGQVSMDLFILSPSVDKTSRFRMGTVKLKILDDTKTDYLQIDSVESEVLNNMTALTFGCSTSSCWDATEPTPRTIGGGGSLSAPTLVSPSDGATDVGTTPSFDWSDVTGATSYNIKVASDASFTTVVINEDVTSSGYTASTALSSGTEYFWKVNATDGSITSSWSSTRDFTTESSGGGSGELVHLTIENRQVVGSDYTFDVYAEPDGTWRVGPCTVIIKYNSLGLDASDYDGNNVGNFDSDLSSGGYSCTQGDYATGQVSMDLFILSPSVDKTSRFRMGTVKLKILDDTKTDYLQIDSVESEVLNNMTALTYGCSTSSCWDATEPTPRTIGGGTTILDPPTYWAYIDSTGSNASIIIQDTNLIRLCDRRVQTGDAIGAFFDDSGTEKCAGYGIWTNGETLAFSAWGDDAYSAIKDGFSTGETITYKMWDASEGEEYYVDYHLQSGSTTYSSSGINDIDEMSAICEVTHTIYLGRRWNMISSYVIPEDDSTSHVLSDISSNILLAKNGAGAIYYPGYGINQFPIWDTDAGYLIYMYSSDTLEVTGEQVSDDRKIYMGRRWNMISYLCDAKQPISSGFADINSNILLAKNGAGAIYYPGYGIDQIDTLHPGQGYLVYMYNSDTLDYPVPSALKVPAGFGTPFETKFAKPSPNNATVIIESNMPDGTEIEAYNSIGVLVGSGTVKNGKSPIAVYGDDEFTQEIDGATRDEIITFKAISDNIKQDLTVESVSSGISGEQLDAVRYSTNALIHAKVSGNVPQAGGTADLTITPNPAENETVLGINFAISGDITVEIYDLQGERVAEVYSGKACEQITIDTSKLPSGTYQALVKTNDEVKSVRFVVVR